MVSQQVFKKFDADESGAISRDELGEAAGPTNPPKNFHSFERPQDALYIPLDAKRHGVKWSKNLGSISKCISKTFGEELYFV